MQILDDAYQTLLKTALSENRRVQKQMGKPLDNFNTLYNNTEMPFDDRTIHVRWVKLPTFVKEGKPNYYAVCIADLPFWRKGELQGIYRQAVECFDNTCVDSYTIFLYGRLYGHIDRVQNTPMRRYKTFVQNTDNPSKENMFRMYSFIERFLVKRVQIMTRGGVVFGSIADDVKRLNELTGFLKVLQNDDMLKCEVVV